MQPNITNIINNNNINNFFIQNPPVDVLSSKSVTDKEKKLFVPVLEQPKV